MHKNSNQFTSPSHLGKWLMRGLTLGIIAAGAVVWLRLLTTESQSNAMHAWRSKFTDLKDAINKAAQKMRDANPSAKEEILDLESELQPGG